MLKIVNGEKIKLTPLDISERETEVLSLMKLDEANIWLRDRQAAYAKLNQDEMRYDDLINGTTTWQDTIAAVKAKYPKPVL